MLGVMANEIKRILVKMEKISIIVPIYNSEKTLKECLKSILNQTYKNLDIILIDDGSTDKSGEICNYYQSIDKRIRVCHKKNGGVITARNRGIQMIPDEGYTTFCDSDDKMKLDAIEKMYKYAVSTNADIVCGNLQRFLSCGFKLKKNIPPSLREERCYNKKEIYEKILPSFFGITDFTGYMHTKLYRNKILKKSLDFKYPNIKFFQEDIMFNLPIMFIVNKIAVIPDIVYYYRVGGATNKYMPSFLEDCIELYKFKMLTIEKQKLSEELRYTTSVELKNECFTWLEMKLDYLEKNNVKEEIMQEIKKCCNIPEIEQAVNYPKDDNSGMVGFRNMVKNKQYEEILELLLINSKKRKIKRIIRSLVLKL